MYRLYRFCTVFILKNGTFFRIKMQYKPETANNYAKTAKIDPKTQKKFGNEHEKNGTNIH